MANTPVGSAGKYADPVIVVLILALEGVCLYLGQRKIFGGVYQTLGRTAAYFLAAPGTILHELAHFLMCKLLGVRTGEVSLFKPQQMEDGSITLGYVQHERTDPLRGALVAIAPVLLVPPLLVGVSCLMFGSGFLGDPDGAVLDATWWLVPIWLYLVISAGQGAFPSTGDHVGMLGFVALALLGGAIVYLVPAETLQRGLEVACLVLALPAVSAGIFLAALSGRRRGR